MVSDFGHHQVRTPATGSLKLPYGCFPELGIEIARWAGKPKEKEGKQRKGKGKEKGKKAPFLHILVFSIFKIDAYRFVLLSFGTPLHPPSFAVLHSPKY